MESVRVDRWLAAARIFRSRSRATAACGRGKVELNERPARPPHPVRIGDRIEVVAPRRVRVLEVLALAQKRLAPQAARELYLDHSPEPERPPPEQAQPLPAREPGSGRPTKRQRRALRRLVGRD